MKPSKISDVQMLIREYSLLSPGGSKTKTGLMAELESVTTIDLTSLAGVLEYQPNEFTFTALAGTRVAEIDEILSKNGQHLPFDPILVERGATLGGTVASGLNGPGRYRCGGVRDFILGVQFVDGQGGLVRSGGKVVKNVAGFDISKLMVGSLGQLGAMVELNFKVFPLPAVFYTLRTEYPTIQAALNKLTQLANLPLDLFAIDLEPSQGETTLFVRLGSSLDIMPARIDRIRKILGDCVLIEGDEESVVWREMREFSWVPEGDALVKIPLTPKRVPEFDTLLESFAALRRYSVGGNVAWVAWPESVDRLDALLSELDLSGLVVLGPGGQPRVGINRSETFFRRVKQALDPLQKWVEV